MGSGALKMWDEDPYLSQQPPGCSQDAPTAGFRVLTSSLLKFNLQSFAHP